MESEIVKEYKAICEAAIELADKYIKEFPEIKDGKYGKLARHDLFDYYRIDMVSMFTRRDISKFIGEKNGKS